MLPAADRFLFNLDYIIWSLSKSLHLSSEAYCDLETIDSDTVFVANDGSLASLVRIDGSVNMIGSSEFSRMLERLTQCLKSCLDNGQHVLQFLFARDPQPAATRQLMEQAFSDALATMRRLDLDLQALWERKLELLARHYCGQETLLLALWSMPTCLSRVQQAALRSERRQHRARYPNGVYAAPLAGAAGTLRELHEAFCRSLIEDLRTLGLVLEPLSAHTALRACRALQDPAHTANDWSARLPGDPLCMDMPSHDQDGDLSCVLWPSIASQIYAQGAELQGPATVQIGERCFSSASMHIGPRSVTAFNTLFRSLLNETLPWMVSIRLITDGYSQVAHKQRLATLLSFLNSPRRVKRALTRVQDAMEQGEVFVGLQLQFCTWVDGEAQALLRERSARLIRAAQSWGGMELRRNDGNPLHALSATLPLLRRRAPANTSAAPVADAARLLPLTRPASPWRRGSVLLRTPDGKPYPYEPFSSRQRAWITLIFAPMGSGKSVLLNSLNTALVLAAGNQQLPRIAVLDIGPSSAGMISLIREALPPHRRREVDYIRLRNTSDFTINPLDTLLGCRTPLPAHRAFLVNLLTLLATPVGEDKPYEAVPGIASMLIELGYQAASDEGAATKRYQPRLEPVVDQLLEQHDFHADAQSSWWEIVDYLFDHGEYHGAGLAQRHAVPTLGELAAHAHEDSLRAIYTGTAPGGNEGILDYCYRSITDAIRRYAVLGGVSRFTTTARIISLDLDEVAPRGGPDADRQTAVMYMLGRQVICADIYLRREHLDGVAEPYRQWHEQRLAAGENDARRICFDEFHRTEAVAAVRRQVLLDIREGRKWKVEVILASQRLQDFDATIIDLATTAFILGAGNYSLEETVATFRLPDAAARALQTIASPGRDGAGLLAWFDTSRGRFTHLLNNTLTAEEIWAYSTTREDMALRQILYRRLGPVQARRALARCYPGGSVKAECERRQGLLQEADPGQQPGDLIGQIADEVSTFARETEQEGDHAPR